MHATSFDGFEDWILPLSRDLWPASANHRSRQFHASGRCPQRHSPLVASSGDDVLCAVCSEAHHEQLAAVVRRLRTQKVTTWERALQLLRRPFFLQQSFSEALDHVASTRGWLTNPAHIIERAWFVQLVPDALDRELCEALLHFVRSGDRLHRTSQIPFERLADRHGITEDDCRLRLATALSVLRAGRPDFVERNIDAPLSERLTETGDDAWFRDDASHEALPAEPAGTDEVSVAQTTGAAQEQPV